jgi:Carboxypeptidase regulatory-like domain/TonB-dependent Receptor Plug Domain
MTVTLRCAIVLTFLVSAALPATAQQGAGPLEGTVTDANGAPIASATVAVLPARARAVSTDAKGRFQMLRLPAGTYSVVAMKAGYVPRTLADVAVGSAGATVNFALETASMSTLQQIASVTENEAGALNTSSSSVNYLSRDDFLSQGQLQIGHVLDQTPGVISARPASANPAAPGSITSPNLRGALDYEKATLIDGHPLINGSHGDYPTMLVNSLLFDDIEVVKGPTAYAPEIDYGIGGTLNFRTGEPTRTLTESSMFGVDTTSGQFAALRVSDTFGKVGVLLGFVSYGTQGPLQSYPSLVFLPVGTNIGGLGAIQKTAPTTSGTPINGFTGAYPIKFAVGNPANAYTSLVACCQNVTSNYLTHGELLKLKYDFSSATSFTAGYIGIQGSYDGAAASFTQLESTFAPAAGYGRPGLPFAGGQTILLNNTTMLPDSQLLDNEPMFEGDLRTTVGNDTILARYYSAVLGRITTSDLSAPSANFTTPLTLYGTAQLGTSATPAIFNGSTESVTIPTPYSNSVEHDDLHGTSLEIDHPIGPDQITFSVDSNTALTNVYRVTGSSSNPLGNLSISVPGGTRQVFTTYLLRGILNLGDKMQMTLANYYSTFNSTYAIGTTATNDAIFQNSVTMHDDPRIGVSYRASRATNLRLSIGSAIAPPYPALISVFNQTPAQVYTPGASSVTITKNAGGLLPETSFGYDVGADARVFPNAVLSSDLYLTNIRNQFVGVIFPSGTTYQGVPVFINTNENLAQSRYAGVEATLNFDPPRGYGYTLAGALQRAYAYNIPPGFYYGPAGPYSQNLGVVSGINFFGTSTGFNGISNKSEAYSQAYAAIHLRGNYGQYAELGLTYYGSNNTFNIPAFIAGTATFRQPLGPSGAAIQISADNLFAANARSYVLYAAGIGAPLANGEFGLRPIIPYGPTALRFMLLQGLGR